MMMCRNTQDYITAFIEGYICAIIGERMTIAKVSEAELDDARGTGQWHQHQLKLLGINGSTIQACRGRRGRNRAQGYFM